MVFGFRFTQTQTNRFLKIARSIENFAHSVQKRAKNVKTAIRDGPLEDRYVSGK